MNITRYEPWRLLDQMANELDRAWGRRLAANSQEDSAIATSAWVPAVDIKEESNRFIIEADIPGVDPKDIEISMENGVLTLKGERKLENREEGKDYRRVERVYGTFYRRFSLPESADAEKVSATGKNGVLSINIPKREVAQPRKIEIKAH